jgi:hypothetical protein
MTRAATFFFGTSIDRSTDHKDRHMNRTHSTGLRKSAIALAAAALGCSFAPVAQAFDYSSDGLDLRVDSKLTVGAAWRVSARDKKDIGISNGGESYSTNNDDGDLAFDKGDLVESPIKLTSDATLTYGNYGLFVRGSYVYDPTLEQKKYFNPDNYGQPGKEAPASEYQKKTNEVRDELGHDGTLLDAYFYGSNRIFDRTLSYKIGRQILNWGESTLVQNGLNSLVSADANKLRVPGYDINEVVKPVGMVTASYDLVENVSLESFYQFEWRRTDPDAAGSFFSTNDFIGAGGDRANISFAIPGENDIGSTVPRVGDHKGSNSGQFGAALHFFIPQLNGIDMAVYAAKYNSRLPVVSGHSATVPLAPFGGDYFLEYPDDIKMFGASFNASLPWGLALQGEYSLKLGQPLQIDDVEILLTGLGIPSQLNPTLGGASGNQYLKGYRRKDVSQADVALTRVFGPANWLQNDQTILLAEFAYDYVHDFPSSNELRFDAPGTYLPGYDAATDGPVRAGFLVNRGKFDAADPDGRDDLPANTASYATSASYGYKLVARLTYNNAIGAVALNPTIRFDHDLHGYTPQPIGNFVQGRKMINVAVGWTYHSAWSGDIGYVNYFGGGEQNLLADRDYVEASAAYSF